MVRDKVYAIDHLITCCFFYRVTVDGVDSNTVFNGDEAMTDRRYTRHNTYLAGRVAIVYQEVHNCSICI